jgi:hypothetical protein
MGHDSIRICFLLISGTVNASKFVGDNHAGSPRGLWCVVPAAVSWPLVPSSRFASMRATIREESCAANHDTDRRRQGARANGGASMI